MAWKGDHRPTLQEEVIYRPKDQMQLFDRKRINSTIAVRSDGVPCAPFRKFGLYVHIDSTLTPHNLHIEVEFLDRWSGQWYTYKQGLFAALFYEDVDTAAGIYECFVGDVLGRAFRIKLTGVDDPANGHVVDATNYFTVSIAVDFWN